MTTTLSTSSLSVRHQTNQSIKRVRTCVKYTLQETFNKIVIHLLTQKKVSVDWTDDHCRYKGENGTQCAVGCLDEYALLSEGDTINEPYNQTILEKLGYPVHKRAIELYAQLQWTHDNKKPYQWKAYLEETAKTFNLNMVYV